MPLDTISPGSTASLLSQRRRLGRRMKAFIHSPLAASTDLLHHDKEEEDSRRLYLIVMIIINVVDVVVVVVGERIQRGKH